MKVSLITTSYNSAATIRDTIESVLRQTYHDIEYIVKDGGSTDGTTDILKEYEPKFHGRMKWVSNTDRGIYDGMNEGIKLATGEVIGILNSDDFFTNDHAVENVAKAFGSKGTDAVYGDVHFVRESDLNKTVRYYSSKLFRPFWLRFGFMPAHPAFYLKRAVYMKAGLYNINYKIAADFELMVRLFHKHKISYYYLDKDLVTMRIGGASTKNWHNRKIGLVESIRACKGHGIYTNKVFASLKYVYKIFQFRDIPRKHE